MVLESRDLARSDDKLKTLYFYYRKVYGQQIWQGGAPTPMRCSHSQRHMIPESSVFVRSRDKLDMLCFHLHQANEQQFLQSGNLLLHYQSILKV